MISTSLKKTAVAAAVASTLTGAAISAAEADVLNLSWTGAFTILNSTGAPFANSPSDWASGYYAIAGPAHGTTTAFGWYGNRTPVSGTMSFDTVTGAGVGTLVPFTFFGDGTVHTANAVGMSFQVADTLGTIIGTMLFSWGGGGHPVSIVLDGSGMFGAIAGGAFADGPTSTISGVGALPATNGLDFDSTIKGVKAFPLGPSPIATTTTNTNSACAGVAITQQVNAYTISTLPAFSTCFPLNTSDTIGGSPFTAYSFTGFNPNFDVTSVHLDSISMAPSGVPVPAAVWLFGSGLLGLMGLARRKKNN